MLCFCFLSYLRYTFQYTNSYCSTAFVHCLKVSQTHLHKHVIIRSAIVHTLFVCPLFASLFPFNAQMDELKLNQYALRQHKLKQQLPHSPEAYYCKLSATVLLGNCKIVFSRGNAFNYRNIYVMLVSFAYDHVHFVGKAMKSL